MSFDPRIRRGIYQAFLKPGCGGLLPSKLPEVQTSVRLGADGGYEVDFPVGTVRSVERPHWYVLQSVSIPKRQQRVRDLERLLDTLGDRIPAELDKAARKLVGVRR